MKEGLQNSRRQRWLAAASRRRGRFARFKHRWHGLLQAIGIVLSSCVYIAAIVVPVCLLLYAGFDTDALNKLLLLKLLGYAQCIFITNVLFSLIFRYKQTLHDSLFIKRAADVLLLLTLIPVLFPHGAGPVGNVLHWLHSRYFLFTGLGIYSLAELSYGTMQLLGKRTNPSLILSASFILFILVGSFVLMLPRCTTAHIGYIDALFMAASAVSMTGLSTVDVAADFTPLGWAVIAILMQIGALGVLTFTSFFALFFSGRTSIYNQLLMRDFVYSKSMSSLLPVLLYIFVFTLVIEICGAVAIYLSLPQGLFTGRRDAAMFAAFHSVSAFCNAGFSTLPQGMATPAFLDGNQIIYYIMAVLILAGGIGFPILVNFKDALGGGLRHLRCRILRRPYHRRVHVYDTNSKLVLTMTAILFGVGAISFYILEYNGCFEGLTTGQRIAQAVFCSTTVRTAGFCTFGPATWLGPTLLVAMALMWIGCASQSMGGGIKVNAFAAVLLNLWSIITGRKGVTVYNRTIAPTSIRRANAVVCLSIFAIGVYAVVLMILQPELPARYLLFEAFSAITTIGMSLGVTPELSDISKVVVASAMFLGRVGIISVLCGLVGTRPDRSEMLPSDDIIIN